MKTGQEDSKFGFGWHSGAAAEAVGAGARLVVASSSSGCTCTSARRCSWPRTSPHAVETVAPLARELALPELCVGGGLGVAYVEGEEAPTHHASGPRRSHDVCQVDAGIDARITAEPGRSIVAQAGITLYTVGTIKEIPGIRTYVSVDGGMSDNPRPVLYGSGYETFLPAGRGRRSAPRRSGWSASTASRATCWSARAGCPADLAVGDVLVTPVTGAYGHSMGSNYNKVPRPRWCSSPTATPALVVRRETYDDLLRLDVG